MPHLEDRDLDALAHLVRLDLSSADRGALLRDLARVLTYVDRLAAVDDLEVAPLRHPALGDDVRDATHDPVSLRPDVSAPGLSVGALETLAPAWREGRVEVPRTVDQDA